MCDPVLVLDELHGPMDNYQATEFDVIIVSSRVQKGDLFTGAFFPTLIAIQIAVDIS